MMIRQVGSTPILPTHIATCHCGSVVLALDLPDGIVNPYEIPGVPTNDGINHPADRGARDAWMTRAPLLAHAPPGAASADRASVSIEGRRA